MKVKAFAAVVLLAASIGALAQNAAPPAATPATPSAAAQKKSWFVRLNPPRPTFPQDMTEPEKKLMQDHYVYWTARFKVGVCVFGGPVMDPKGVYGVLAIRAVNEEEARAIASADPSVKAGLMHIEVAEMNIAFLPGAKYDDACVNSRRVPNPHRILAVTDHQRASRSGKIVNNNLRFSTGPALHF